MKKRVLLWGVLLVITSVLVFSFIINGCSNKKTTEITQVKKEKELRYPEWPGLDEKIEYYNNIIDSSPAEENVTSIYRMGVKDEDIKWHFVILFKNKLSKNKLNEVMKRICDKNAEIYKNVNDRTLYIKILNMENFKEYYDYFLNWRKNDSTIHAVYINRLIEYSWEHYAPIDNLIYIRFNKILSEEEKINFASKYNIQYKYDDYFEYVQNKDFIKVYVKIFDEPIVEIIAFNDLYSVRIQLVQ